MDLIWDYKHLCYTGLIHRLDDVTKNVENFVNYGLPSPFDAKPRKYLCAKVSVMSFFHIFEVWQMILFLKARVLQLQMTE